MASSAWRATWRDIDEAPTLTLFAAPRGGAGLPRERPVGSPEMNGAESLVSTLVDHGVDICFANPGTSEMHFLAALGNNEKMRCVLCLFEGVATGAADGWYRMKDTPASTLLHLGPGLANGLANIHNAKRASSGMVNIIGEPSASHLKYAPPLTSDIEGLARPLSHWVRRVESSHTVAWDVSAAVAKA